MKNDGESLARRVAHILGNNCAAARALKELEQKRAAGLEAKLIKDKSLWIVITGEPKRCDS